MSQAVLPPGGCQPGGGGVLGWWRWGVGRRRSRDPMPSSGPPFVSSAAYHRREHEDGGYRAPHPTFQPPCPCPCTTSIAVTLPLAFFPSPSAHWSALPLTPCLEGPSKKACGCPQSPVAQNPLTGQPWPRHPQALRNSFAWPWSCPRGSRRSWNDGASRRRRT